MTLNKVQTEIAEKLGQLLAESPLDEEIRSAIIGNLDKMPEDMVFKLMDALEMESEELDRIVFEMNLFLKEQTGKWEKVEKEQQDMADAIVNKWVAKLGQE